MGAPKQKWTPEEEAALRAGIQKYGVGKWSVILKDPEFNALLCSRSNVDLKVLILPYLRMKIKFLKGYIIFDQAKNVTLYVMTSVMLPENIC